MLAVGLSKEGVLPYLAKVPENSVVVACSNAPNNVTLSGDQSSIDQLLQILGDDGVFVRKLRVKTAYHSHHMKVISEDYLAALGSLEPPRNKEGLGVTMFSSVTAAPISTQELDASYWIRNMVSPVHFSEAVKALVTQSAPGKTRRKVAVNYAAAIEIGPSDALKGPLNQILAATDERLAIMYTSMLARGSSAEVSAFNAAGRLWATGLNIDLHTINFQAEPITNHQVLASLPPYPFNHSKGYWHSSAWGKTYRFLRKARTDLLGLRLQNQDKSEPRWQNFIRLSEQPWIADHRVQQMVLYPGAAMITMAIQAAHEMLDQTRLFRGIEAHKILFKRPLLIPNGDNVVETAIHLRPINAPDKVGKYSFRIFSQAEDEEWQENCSGLVSIHYNDGQDRTRDLAWQSDASLYSMIRKRATRKLAPRTFYKFFDKKMNLQYGPLHQNVTECMAGIREGHGRITIPDTKAVMPSQFEYPHLIHPATLDSVFHMQALGYLHTLSGDESLVPISIESVYVAADIPAEAGFEFNGYAKSIKTETGDFIGDIVLSDDAWSSPKAVVRGFLSRDMSTADSTTLSRQTQKCTEIKWEELPRDPEKAVLLVKPSEIIILRALNASPLVQSLAEKLTRKLEDFGCTTRVVTMSEVASEEGTLSKSSVISLVEIDEPAIARWTEADLKLFKETTARTSAMLWVTRGGVYDSQESLDFSITTGLLRTLRAEMPQLRLPHLDLSRTLDIAQDKNADSIFVALESSILSNNAINEQEFVFRDDKILVPRLKIQESFHQEIASHVIQPEPYQSRLADLSGVVVGSLDQGSIIWQHAEVSNIGEVDLEIQISAVSLEPADLESSGVLGRDAIGIILKVGSAVKDFAIGDTVLVCASHTFRTSIVIHSDLVKHVPAFVDPNLMVTLPSALCTAQGALLDLGRLEAGETVLISAQPGTIERALISLATQIGAEVYVMAQNSNHEQILVESLGIDEDHVILSATMSSESNAKAILSRKEVDIVASTLSGGPMQQALGFLSDFGRFISIGKNSLQSSAISLPSNITVANFDLERMRICSRSKVAGLFKSSWDRAAKYGLPSAAPTRSFPLSNIEKSLAYLKSPRCFGNAVIKLGPDHKILVPPPPPATLKLNPTATYVLSGGLGGIGRSIADMMFEAGARNISFISRSGAKAEEAKQFLGSLQNRGCNAQAFKCDITDPAQVQDFVEKCQEKGENIKGVLQCAMLLRDSMFENMTFEQWSQATQPKVAGSWNLHKHMPSDLDFFIMLSSMAGVIGNPGQANYSAAGTYQDALSQHRRSKGLTSMTIDLGIVSDVGYIAENPEQFERLDYLENLFISERDLHLILSAAMLGKTRDGLPIPAQLVTGVGKELLAEGSLGSAMSADLKYTELHSSLQNGSSIIDSSEDALIKENLRSATSVREACIIVETVLSTQLARALNMEPADVDLEKPMHAFGGESSGK